VNNGLADAFLSVGLTAVTVGPLEAGAWRFVWETFCMFSAEQVATVRKLVKWDKCDESWSNVTFKVFTVVEDDGAADQGCDAV
jgi:hypothetical protein